MEIDLRSVPTKDLIAEINRRDLFEELSNEKREWLKDNNYKQIIHQFYKPFPNPCFYSLDYLRENSLEELKDKQV